MQRAQAEDKHPAADESYKDLKGASGQQLLCSYGYGQEYERQAATPFCITRQLGKYGTPGGAVCEGSKSIAECYRPWE